MTMPGLFTAPYNDNPAPCRNTSTIQEAVRVNVWPKHLTPNRVNLSRETKLEVRGSQIRSPLRGPQPQPPTLGLNPKP